MTSGERQPSRFLSGGPGNENLSVLLTLLAVAGCGTDKPDRDPASDADESTPATTARADLDPCALILVSEWEAATDYEDIEADRSAPDTCDFLSDTLWGVVGTVSLQNREFLAYMARRSETSPLSGLGDEAVTMPLGLVFRTGERVVMLTVNPSVTNQAEVAQDLASIALGRL